MNNAISDSSQSHNGSKATTLLHELGQSLWLDNITRDRDRVALAVLKCTCSNGPLTCSIASSRRVILTGKTQ
jgi:hypothetical protein